MKKYVIMRNLLYLLKWLGNVERVMSRGSHVKQGDN